MNATSAIKTLPLPTKLADSDGSYLSGYFNLEVDHCGDPKAFYAMSWLTLAEAVQSVEGFDQVFESRFHGRQFSFSQDRVPSELGPLDWVKIHGNYSSEDQKTGVITVQYGGMKGRNAARSLIGRYFELSEV